MARQKSSRYKFISLSIKLAIVALAFGFIYKQVFYRTDSDILLEVLHRVYRNPPYVLICSALGLMCINWGLEALKWKLLVRKKETISFFHSLKAVLSGVTIGAFTPNRFGEFAGRIFYLERTGRAEAVLMTFAGSAAQLIVTIITGCLALVAYGFYFALPGQMVSVMILYSITILLVIFCAFLLLMYFNTGALVSIIGRFRIFNRIGPHAGVLKEYTSMDLAKVFALSLLRYGVFTFQFYLMLEVFGIDVPPFEAAVLISLTFLAITVIPSVALAELGIRGSAAVAFIGLASPDNAGIIAASFSLWIINIAFPAIAGGFFVFGLKFFKEKS